MTDRGMSVSDAAAFPKGYSSAAKAATARARSLAARRAGVPTPAVLGQAGPKILSFERIDARGQPSLAEIVRVVAHLHRMSGNGLGRFDPFLRIRPRLAGAPARIGAMAEELMARDAALHWPKCAAIHGDLHLGQVVRDSSGKVWLIDLDDMALAPPEADLGNLAAWLATQVPGRLGDLAQGALERVSALARDADRTWTGHFCQIALVRRGLKLAGKGQGWVIDQLSLRA